MSSVVEARSILTDLIGMMAPGDRLKNRFPSVARMTGITERRLRGLWHGEARRIDAAEMDSLRAAKWRRDCDSANRVSVKARQARVAYEQAGRLEAVAAALEASDAEFHAQAIGLARSEAERLRNFAGAGVG